MDWDNLHQFNEHHPEFKGFSEFFEAEIHPTLLADQAERLPSFGGGTLTTILSGLFLTVCIGLLAFAAFKPPWPVYLGITALCMVVAFWKVKWPTVYVSFKTKKDIVGGICRYLGWTYESDFVISPHIDLFKSLGLISSKFDREIYEDRMKGEAHGAKFEFHEAHLLKRRNSSKNTSWKTTFRGQFLVLNFPRRSFGRTVVVRDKGPRNPKTKDGMKRVGLADPVFEKAYEAYGTDQVEARYLLTPTFMQRLVDLEHCVDGKNMRFGFMGSHLLIAIETGNRYEVGSMFASLTYPARTQKILDEIGAIYDVIDGVMKR